MLTATITGIDEFLAELERIAHTFDLDKNNLGTRIMDVAAQKILENMDAECGPDDIPWPPLSLSYLKWKTDIAPQAPIGVLYGRMKTWEQIAGERTVTADLATMEYGLDIVAKTEAVWFTRDGIVTGTNQPPRPFYALNFGATLSIDNLLELEFEKAW